MKSTKRSAVDTVLQFLERINQHDADKLAEDRRRWQASARE
jgi:hypothetical protein